MNTMQRSARLTRRMQVQSPTLVPFREGEFFERVVCANNDEGRDLREGRTSVVCGTGRAGRSLPILHACAVVRAAHEVLGADLGLEVFPKSISRTRRAPTSMTSK